MTARRGGTELVVSVRELVSGGAAVGLVLRVHNGGDADSPAFAELEAGVEDLDPPVANAR
ncbi:hypothetical protein [Nocardiopsis synnemataformans]|uniref:hypothetical protein n=1 Tax=Nocardiopsis synnemataformans TaxID=61305 RepID=UPI003EBE79A9